MRATSSTTQPLTVTTTSVKTTSGRKVIKLLWLLIKQRLEVLLGISLDDINLFVTFYSNKCETDIQCYSCDIDCFIFLYLLILILY